MDSKLASMIILLFFALVAWIIWRIYQTQTAHKAFAKQAKALGYRPVPETDTTLAQRIAYLQPQGRNNFPKLHSLHHKRYPDYTIYLFGMDKPNEADSTETVSQGMALVSSALSLPRFALIPRIPQENLLQPIIDGMLTRLLERSGLTTIDTKNSYHLAGSDPERVQELFAGFTPQSLHTQQICIFLGGMDTIFGMVIPIPAGENAQPSFLIHRFEENLATLFGFLEKRRY